MTLLPVNMTAVRTGTDPRVHSWSVRWNAVQGYKEHRRPGRTPYRVGSDPNPPPPPPPPPPPLVADMSASPASPTVGQTVTLTATVTGGTTPYSYAFSQLTGTAVTLAGSGSSRTFTASAGLKTFQVVVTDSAGVVDTSTAVVSVGSTLTASLGRSPASPTVGQTVTLTVTPAGGTGPYTYVFSQTAGTTVTLAGSGTGRTFTMPTTTTDLAFRVVVTDSVAATANATVTVARALTASLTSSPAAPDTGVTVTLTASAVGGSPAYSYVFSQVSGQTVTLSGSGVTRTFTAPATGGTLVLRVTVTDSQGTVSTADRTVIVTNPPPPPPPPPPLVADMSASPANPTVGQTVTLTAVVTGGTTPYSYAFSQLSGTAVTLAGSGATRTFTATAGLKTFQVVVTDSVGVTDPAVVSVGSTLTATLARSPASPTVGATVTLTATPTGGTGPYTYVFSQTAGTTAALSGSGTTRTFTMPSTTTDLAFRVVVTDAASATANATVTVARALTASLTSSPAAPVAGGTVTLTASAVGGAPTYTYVFSQVSGATVTLVGSGATRTFTMPSTGAPPVLRVTVTDSAGTVSTADRTVTATLAAGLTANPTDTLVSRPVTLTATATGGTSPYTYTFTQTAGTTVTLTGTGASRSFTTPATAGTLTFRVTVADSAAGSVIATTSVTVSVSPPTGVMWMGCSDSVNSHGGTEVWDGWRVYTSGAMTSRANRTGTQRPKFLAYSKDGDNLGGANPNYTSVYNEVLADLNTFYYNGTGNTPSARAGIKLYWSNGNENSDKGALTLPHTQAKIDAYVVSQRALYDAVHLVVGGVRRFPDAFAGSNPTQNQEQNGDVQGWLHQSAPFHDFVMWSMYPPGRKTTPADPTYNWPSFVESQRTNLQNGFLIRCFYRTQQAQLAARDATGNPNFSLLIGCGEVGIGDDPGDSTTRPYYAVHALAAGMQTLSNQYGIPMPFTCWWDNQSDATSPQNILSDEPSGTSPSTREAWQGWRTYNHQYGGTHPASWAGNPKPGWKTTGTVV